MKVYSKIDLLLRLEKEYHNFTHFSSEILPCIFLYALVYKDN